MHSSRAIVPAAALVATAFLLCAPRPAAVNAKNRTAFRFQQPTAAPTLKVYSRETIVDVTVTDAKGNPVHGLTRDDFTIKEDGKPQPIKSFAEFGTQPARPLPKLPPNTYTNLQPPAPSGATNILWLDFTNGAPTLASACCAVPPGPILGAYPVPIPAMGAWDLANSLARQKRTKQYAMNSLREMSAGTRAAVLGTWFPGSLRVLQGVTADPALLSAAIDSMPYDQDGMVMLSPKTTPALGPPEDWCAQQDRRNRMTVESLTQIASDLAQIKGRKNLLWYTINIHTLVDQHNISCLTDLSKQVQRAYGLLAAAQVTVYPISVRGVEVNPQQANDMLGLETIAEATGGAAFYNSNDLGALTAQAMKAGADYYTLSYVPPGSEYDGRHHSVKVIAAKPGLKLTYRDEYYAEDPRALAATPGLNLAVAPDATGPIDMRTEMSRAMPTSTALLFDVQVEPSTEPAKPTDPQVIGVLVAKHKDKPLTRYSFQYAFSGREIALTDVPNGKRHGSLEFDLAAYDGEGNVVTSLRQAIQLNLSADQAAQLQQSPFRYFQQLDLPPGALFLRVGILDRTSNKVGTLEIPVTVAKQVRTAEK